MTYADLLQKLYQTNLFNAKKNGLENCLRLDHIFNYPHHTFQSIHIAGTNGKGSVATMIAKALQIAGYKVGLFTSPHVTCFRERILLNGERIPKQDVEIFLNLLFDAIELHDIPATFFELTTNLAHLYFAKEKVDFVVMETGLGGRFDATNVIQPLLSVITSISLDHTDVLGNTIDAIAEEKSGIIKPNTPVVIGPKVPLPVIEKRARLLNSPLIQVTDVGITFEVENQLIAAEALKCLAQSVALPSEAIAQGLNVRPPCRLETFCSNPLIILDVAHNPDGFQNLFKALRFKFPNKKFNALFGICKNKDISGCISILAEQAQKFYPVEAANGRGLESEKLATKLLDFGVDAKRIFRYPSTKESFLQARLDAEQKNQVLVVCGTFFIMDEIKKILSSIT